MSPKTDELMGKATQANLLLTVINTDVNLSRLPIFALTRKGLKTKLVREWIFAETRKRKYFVDMRMKT